MGGNSHVKCTACCFNFTISHGGRGEKVKQVEIQNCIGNIQHIKRISLNLMLAKWIKRMKEQKPA